MCLRPFARRNGPCLDVHAWHHQDCGTIIDVRARKSNASIGKLRVRDDDGRFNVAIPKLHQQFFFIRNVLKLIEKFLRKGDGPFVVDLI